MKFNTCMYVKWVLTIAKRIFVHCNIERFNKILKTEILKGRA